MLGGLHLVCLVWFGSRFGCGVYTVVFGSGWLTGFGFWFADMVACLWFRWWFCSLWSTSDLLRWLCARRFA